MKAKQALALLVCGVMVAGCSSTASTSETSTSGTYTPGTYSGEAQGYGGTVSVSITTDASTITDVTITGDDETPNVGGAALEDLTAQVLEAQSAAIDGVTGATVTSTAVKNATQVALDAAMGNTGAATGEKTPVADGSYTAKTPS